MSATVTAAATTTETVEVAWQEEVLVADALDLIPEAHWVEETHPDLPAAYRRVIALYRSPEFTPSRTGGVYVNGTLTSQASALAWIERAEEQARRAAEIADARLEAVMVRLFMQETNFTYDFLSKQQVLVALARSAFRDTYRDRAVEILRDIDEAVARF